MAESCPCFCSIGSSNCYEYFSYVHDDIIFIFQISFDGIYGNMRMVHILTSVVVSLHWEVG